MSLTTTSHQLPQIVVDQDHALVTQLSSMEALSDDRLESSRERVQSLFLNHVQEIQDKSHETTQKKDLLKIELEKTKAENSRQNQKNNAKIAELNRKIQRVRARIVRIKSHIAVHRQNEAVHRQNEIAALSQVTSAQARVAAANTRAAAKRQDLATNCSSLHIWLEKIRLGLVYQPDLNHNSW